MKYNDNGEWKEIGIKTADTLPIGTVVDYDGTTVPSGWEQYGSDDYSTTETFTGKYWLGNKKIYRKVITKTGLSGTSIDIPHGISNFKTALKVDSSVSSSSGSISYLSNNDIFSYKINKIDATNINVTGNSAFSNWVFICIIEYIKTID